jgi:hypothetical protein
MPAPGAPNRQELVVTARSTRALSCRFRRWSSASRRCSGSTRGSGYEFARGRRHWTSERCGDGAFARTRGGRRGARNDHWCQQVRIISDCICRPGVLRGNSRRSGGAGDRNARGRTGNEHRLGGRSDECRERRNGIAGKSKRESWHRHKRRTARRGTHHAQCARGHQRDDYKPFERSGCQFDACEFRRYAALGSGIGGGRNFDRTRIAADAGSAHRDAECGRTIIRRTGLIVRGREPGLFRSERSQQRLGGAGKRIRRATRWASRQPIELRPHRETGVSETTGTVCEFGVAATASPPGLAECDPTGIVKSTGCRWRSR